MIQLLRQTIVLGLATAVLATATAAQGSALAEPSSELKLAAGQVVMVGLNGSNFTQVKEAARAGLIGGVVVFSSSFSSRDELRTKLAELQASAQSPLLIGIDAEGGTINRLGPSKGFELIPSAKEMGERGNESTYKSGKQIARSLKDVGVGLNFAPVVDVAINPRNPVIASLSRSFSDEPNTVVARAKAFVKSHVELGIAPTLKHFPGHGSSHSDSHLGWTDITDTWSEKELAPFKAWKSMGAPLAIMTGHLFNRKLDAVHPASLSRPTIEGVLRKKLGFKGVVISDDMQMGAIAKSYSLDEALTMGLSSGTDVMLFAQQFRNDDPKMLRDTILRLVEAKKIDRKQLLTAAGRVAKLKTQLGLGAKKPSKAP